MLDSLFRNTLAPWQWAVLAAVPPAIIALYFLKLKRVPVEVPSTYLWLKAVEDLHVNSLWQRLRKSVLLLLQLLMVALAMLALLRPGWQGTRLTGERFLFLIDNSASMSATDAEDAEDRLAAAKAAVTGLVDQLEGGMSAMVISFADQARVVQDFTDNKRLLREAVESIRPTVEKTNLLEALKLAEGVAKPGQLTSDTGEEIEVFNDVDAALFLLTDGRGGDVKDFALGTLAPVFVPIGSTETANLSITAMSTRRIDSTDPDRAGERQAYVQVTNLGAENARVVVDLSLATSPDGGPAGDGWQLLDATGVDVPAGESVGLTFPLADAPPGKLRASLSPEALNRAGDALAIDNTAYAPLNDPTDARVLLVSPGNLPVETALATGRAGKRCRVDTLPPGKLASKDHLALAASGAYDLIIYDRCSPPSLPRANTLFLGATPPDAASALAPTTPLSPDADPAQPPTPPTPPEESWADKPLVLDWNRSHPLLAYVELANLGIGRALRLSPPASAATLIDSDDGPLLTVTPRDSFEDAVLAFPILVERDGATLVNTNWFTKRSFPTFWLNVLDYFVDAGDEASAQASAGEAVEIRLTSDVREVVVVTPNGARERLTRLGDEPFQFQRTDRQGVYEVVEQRGGRDLVVDRFAVNLFDRNESDIRLRERDASDPAEAPVAGLRIGFVDVAATAGAAPDRKELWRALLVLALLVLLAEWYVYNRRVYV